MTHAGVVTVFFPGRAPRQSARPGMLPALAWHGNYDKLMDSTVADVQNINYAGGAGSITAAQFLQRFITNKTPWAHLDIAGMTFSKKAVNLNPGGATGFGVRLLNNLIKEFYE